MMKKVFKILLFIVIFIVLFSIVCKILWLPKNPISYFYDEPKNSLDVIYLGASNAYAHFNTTLAYHEYGITTGMVSYNSEPFASTINMIKEARKYQDAKLYVIDLARFPDDYSEIYEGAIRRVTDSMKNSINRIETINKLLKYTNIPKRDYINYYFSFLTYHDTWKSSVDILKNLLGDKELYKGYILDQYNTQKVTIKNQPWIFESEELPKENALVLEELIDYIKKENLEVIFVIPRRNYDKEMLYKRLNTAVKILNDNDMKVLNFNTLEDFKTDLNNDFHNDNHLNAWGSTKYTLYFSRYLHENYKLEDHRDDKKYKSWEMEYQRFKKDFLEKTNEDFDNLVNEYKELGY